MFEVDELKLYYGDDIEISPKIIVTQPKLVDIKNFGEKEYFNAIITLTSVGADMKWQLLDWYGIDYTKIDDYNLFIKYLSKMCASNKYVVREIQENPNKYKDQIGILSDDKIDKLLLNPLELILKDIDLADFKLCKSSVNNELILYDDIHDITIDKVVYHKLVSLIRSMHGLKRNNQIPGNESTKRDLIEDARDEALLNKDKPFKSVLKPLISALEVKTCQCGTRNIWNMNIGSLFYNIKRAFKIQDSDLLLQSAYSGFGNLKGIDKSRLDWTNDN